MVMEVQKDMTAEGSLVRCTQRTSEFEKALDYDYKKCKGCSICVALCPRMPCRKGL